MPKQKPELEIIDTKHGSLELKRGNDKVTLYLEDIAFLIVKFQEHFNEYDKLPF